MDSAEYERQLHALLGVKGPMGHLRCDGVDFLAYRLPDGGQILNEPADKMSPDQRQEVIDRIRLHLGIVAQKRKDNGDPGQSH